MGNFKTKIFVINLKTNSFKRDHINREAMKYGLRFRFFEAVTPDRISYINYKYNPEITSRLYGRPLMKTEIACALSHITLWKKLNLDNYANNYLILEDDVSIIDDFSLVIDNPEFGNYGLVRLCGNKIHYYKEIKKIGSNLNLVEFSYGCLTGGAYLINKSVTKKLIEYCSNLTHAIDIMMDRSFSHKVINYGILPFPVKTDWHNDKSDPLFTDIGVRNADYKKKISFSLKILQKYERLKTSFLKRFYILKLFFKKVS